MELIEFSSFSQHDRTINFTLGSSLFYTDGGYNFQTYYHKFFYAIGLK